MPSINRKLVVAGSSGIVLGTLMWLLGTISVFVMPSLPSVTPYAMFITGFGGALAATLSEDLAEPTTPK